MKDTTRLLLVAEMARARQKFPSNRFLLTALVEEVGECARALLSETPERVAEEAIQVACVALRIVEEGDSIYQLMVPEERLP